MEDQIIRKVEGLYLPSAKRPRDDANGFLHDYIRLLLKNKTVYYFW